MVLNNINTITLTLLLTLLVTRYAQPATESVSPGAQPFSCSKIFQNTLPTALARIVVEKIDAFIQKHKGIKQHRLDDQDRRQLQIKYHACFKATFNASDNPSSEVNAKALSTYIGEIETIIQKYLCDETMAADLRMSINIDTITHQEIYTEIESSNLPLTITDYKALEAAIRREQTTSVPDDSLHEQIHAKVDEIQTQVCEIQKLRNLAHNLSISLGSPLIMPADGDIADTSAYTPLSPSKSLQPSHTSTASLFTLSESPISPLRKPIPMQPLVDSPPMVDSPPTPLTTKTPSTPQHPTPSSSTATPAPELIGCHNTPQILAEKQRTTCTPMPQPPRQETTTSPVDDQINHVTLPQGDLVTQEDIQKRHLHNAKPVPKSNKLIIVTALLASATTIGTVSTTLYLAHKHRTQSDLSSLPTWQRFLIQKARALGIWKAQSRKNL